MVSWIDTNWLKPLLVNKSLEQIKAADDVEEIIQHIMEEDPLDGQLFSRTQTFMSIQPMIRENMENRRMQQLKQHGMTNEIYMSLADADSAAFANSYLSPHTSGDALRMPNHTSQKVDSKTLRESEHLNP